MLFILSVGLDMISDFESDNLTFAGIIISELTTRQLPFTDKYEYIKVYSKYEEITSDGQRIIHDTPLEEFKETEIKNAIINGLRPTLEPETPAKLVQLAEQCWKANPEGENSIKSV